MWPSPWSPRTYLRQVTIIAFTHHRLPADKNHQQITLYIITEEWEERKERKERREWEKWENERTERIREWEKWENERNERMKERRQRRECDNETTERMREWTSSNKSLKIKRTSTNYETNQKSSSTNVFFMFFHYCLMSL